MKRPLVINDFAMALFQIFLFMRKILFSFLSVYEGKNKEDMPYQPSLILYDKGRRRVAVLGE
jgi:hypothetical protein